MITLQPNSDSQKMYLTLEERKAFLPSYSKYLISFEEQSTREKHNFIANVDGSTERYTIISINTDEDQPLDGNIELLNSGYYFYTVYAQDNNTNLDPDNTLGIVEKGLLKVVDTATAYNPTVTTFNDFIVVP